MKLSFGAKALPLGIALALAACGGGQNSSDTANSSVDSANIVDMDNGAAMIDNGGAMTGADVNAGTNGSMNGSMDTSGTGGTGTGGPGTGGSGDMTNGAGTSNSTGGAGGTTPPTP